MKISTKDIRYWGGPYDGSVAYKAGSEIITTWLEVDEHGGVYHYSGTINNMIWTQK